MYTVGKSFQLSAPRKHTFVRFFFRTYGKPTQMCEPIDVTFFPNNLPWRQRRRPDRLCGRRGGRLPLHPLQQLQLHPLPLHELPLQVRHLRPVALLPLPVEALGIPLSLQTVRVAPAVDVVVGVEVAVVRVVAKKGPG